MALSRKRDTLNQVPWFTLTEWHEVYKQVYSNDSVEQTKAYETLLAWKARMPKLPVGIDCTLLIVQVCLRDREWTPKIDNGTLPISYENDLCLMYSTTIMRTLNHICEIGKQASYFQHARKLKIPAWIVTLRHAAAHGHELPSISVLRIAANKLLVWLHEEYWRTEAETIQQYYTNDETADEAEETKDAQTFSDLVELWTAVSLYIHAGYHLLLDIPDLQLQETLGELYVSTDDIAQQKDENDEEVDRVYSLKTAQTVLLSEISRFVSKKSILNKEKIVLEALFNTEAFLPNADVLSTFSDNKKSESRLENDLLPLKMIEFWKDVILLLNEKGMLETLILELIKLANNENENNSKRLIASLWISTITYSFVKLDFAQGISQTLEYRSAVAQETIRLNGFEEKIKRETDNTYPDLKGLVWFNLTDSVPHCLTDMIFVSKLVQNVHHLSLKYIPPMLQLVTPRLNDSNKQLLLNLINIYTVGKSIDTDGTNYGTRNKPFTVDDLCCQHREPVSCGDSEKDRSHEAVSYFLNDQKVRNLNWTPALANYQWSESPIGVLPWQIDSLETISPRKTTLLKNNKPSMESVIVPGILNSNSLNMYSRIDWTKIVKRKKRLKRKYEKRSNDVIINNVLDIVKKRK